LKSGFVSVINWVIDALNKMITAANYIPFVNISYIPHVKEFGLGGKVAPFETIIVGDKGRELFTAGPTGGTVTPNDQTERVLGSGDGPAGGGGPTTIIVYGAERQYVQDLALAIDKLRREGK
jgi:hypothetical protein